MTLQAVSDVVPALTSEDIVKLFAVTYLPLCEMLEKAGVISKTDLAGQVLALSAAQEPAAWTRVATALAIVLRRPAELDTAATAGPPNLTLIIGDKSS